MNGTLRKGSFFQGDLVVEAHMSGGAVIADDLYYFAEVDCGTGYSDKRSLERAAYIANAVNHFDSMYGMLEDIAVSMECEHGVDTDSIFELLAEVRGE